MSVTDKINHWMEYFGLDTRYVCSGSTVNFDQPIAEDDLCGIEDYVTFPIRQNLTMLMEPAKKQIDLLAIRTIKQ